MKPLLGGAALRGTLLAVLIAAVGAVSFATRGVEAAPKSQNVVAKHQVASHVAVLSNVRPEAFISSDYVVAALAAIPIAPVTTRDWRSIGGLATTEDPDALLAIADSRLHQLQGPIGLENQESAESETAPVATPEDAPTESSDPAIASTSPPPSDGSTTTTTVPSTATPTTTVPATTTTTTAPPGGYVSAGDESTFLSLINGTRSSAGVGALSRDGGLDGYARWWAEQMALAGSISHSGMGGIDSSWTISAENVGSGGTAQMLYGVFTGSTGHLANITNGGFTHVGIGAWIDETGLLWTVHIFAAK
ncbi:MAG: CAP domain-containing protein [Acidimicrobiia bacterium]|nr:CAP domain-containing protein [Acidimicrobiia bacterium]